MADNASIARPYAKAVFDLARNDTEFSALVSDPRVDDVKVAELLTDLAKDSLPDGGANLINLLVQNDRLHSLTDIRQQYIDLVAKAKALVNAEVVTAKPLTEDQKSSLAAALEQRLGLKVELEETVDADLVGGAIIKAGDLVIDGSAKGRIEKLTTALMR